MLKWSKNLYYGEQAKKKATRIRWRVEHRRPQYEVYLITLAQNPENQLAKRAKAANLDAIHDTVHEMAKDEARHGKAFEGLLKRYFG